MSDYNIFTEVQIVIPHITHYWKINHIIFIAQHYVPCSKMAPIHSSESYTFGTYAEYVFQTSVGFHVFGLIKHVYQSLYPTDLRLAPQNGKWKLRLFTALWDFYCAIFLLDSNCDYKKKRRRRSYKCVEIVKNFHSQRSTKPKPSNYNHMKFRQNVILVRTTCKG